MNYFLEAKKILEDGYRIKGYMRGFGGGFCAVGALVEAMVRSGLNIQLEDNHIYREHIEILNQIVDEQTNGMFIHISWFNDAVNTTDEDVYKVFEKAAANYNGGLNE
jgi:hypothetical protein